MNRQKKRPDKIQGTTYSTIDIIARISDKIKPLTNCPEELETIICMYGDAFFELLSESDDNKFIKKRAKIRAEFFDTSGVDEIIGNKILEITGVEVGKEKKQMELNAKFPTFEQLKNEELEPLTFLVEGFLPSSGAFILAAKPKVGKTFLALQFAEAVATGHDFLDTYKVSAGDVLYVMTQGGKRVLKSRLKLIGDNNRNYDKFHYLTQILPLQQGGYNTLQSFIDNSNKPKLIVLDMITNMIPNNQHSNYQAWAGIFEELNDFALDNDICILCVYHSKKLVSDDSDSTDDVIGSTGILGSASGILTMRRARDKGEADVFISLREAESMRKTLSFQAGRWHFVGNYVPTKKAEREIYFLLHQDGGLSNQEIADKLEKPKGNISNTIKALFEANYIYQEEKRWYIRENL